MADLIARGGRRNASIGSIIIALFVALCALAADADSIGYRTWERAAFSAYQAGNMAGFLTNMQQARNVRPDHPRLIYNLAVANALNGKSAEAIALLDELADMKLSMPAGQDDDFASLKTAPGFVDAVRRLDDNAKSQGEGVVALTVPEKGLVIEGVAYDARTHDFYFGSIARREILRVAPDGKASVFVGPDAGLWSVFGMRVDSTRRWLWAATSAHEQMPGLGKGDEGKSAIVAFDLGSGQLRGRWDLPDDTAHLVGDLTISPGGDVYATDGRTPTIYRVTNGKLEPFVSDARFGSLQGLDVSLDGRYLFVADYGGGVSRVDLASREVKTYASPPRTTTLGIDGLYVAGNALIGVQNGVSPQRVVRLGLAASRDAIETVDVLEAAAPEFDDLTLGVVVDRAFYFVANSQWNQLDKGGEFAHPEQLEPLRVMQVALP